MICSAALTGTVVCIYNIINIVVAVVVCAEFVFGNVAAGRVVGPVRPTLQRRPKQNTNHYNITDNILSRLSLRNITFDPSAFGRAPGLS